MDVPKFDGSDPIGWSFKVEQFFNYYSVPADQRILISSFHFEGLALSWFQWAKSNNLINSWKGLLDAIQIRFSPTLYEDYKGQLEKIYQISSVEEYQYRFESLSNRVTGVSEAFLLSIFIYGLKPDLKREILVAHPTSLFQAISLARVYEQKYEGLMKSWKSTWPTSSSDGSGLLPTTNVPSLKAIAAPPIRQIPVRTRQLSKEEMKSIREKGLCYFCDDKYIPGHDCRKRLYHLNAMAEGEVMRDMAPTEDAILDNLAESSEDKPAEVSYYAIVGQQNPSTIRVTGVSHQYSIHALIDSGSTHNFVKEKIARSLHWDIVPTNPFKVLIGNGDSLLCNRKCVNVKLSLQNHEFPFNPGSIPVNVCGPRSERCGEGHAPTREVSMDHPREWRALPRNSLKKCPSQYEWRYKGEIPFDSGTSSDSRRTLNKEESPSKEVGQGSHTMLCCNG
ncbi:uncharacterized protein LOC143863761 [Tasmannia lanceolata]|uniref:uncharacterized protein LOC143863761 n=1 Tax=Tasmannia lanceolata TaxID=3420 RepID=UPI0040647573